MINKPKARHLRRAAICSAAAGIMGAVSALAQNTALPCDFKAPVATFRVETKGIPNANLAITDLKLQAFVQSLSQADEQCLNAGGAVELSLKETFQCGDKIQLVLLPCAGKPIDSYEINIPNGKQWEVLSSGTLNALPLMRIWVTPKRDERNSTDSINPLSTILLRWSSLFGKSSGNSGILLASAAAFEEPGSYLRWVGRPLVLALAPPSPPLPQAGGPEDPLQSACGDNYLIDPSDCFVQALGLAERAAAAEKSPDSYLALGVARFANFQFARAGQDLAAGRKLLPEPDSCSPDSGSTEVRSDIAYYLGETALQSNRLDEANREADCALRVSAGLLSGDLRPSRDRAFKARLLLNGGQPAQALSLAQMALSSDTGLYQPADLGSTNHQDRAAAIAAARAVARDQELLGQIYARLDRGAEAVAAMRSARELDQKVHPGNPILASSAEQLAELMTDFGRAKEKASAVGPAEEALRILEDNFGEYNTHTSSGSYTMAATLFHQAANERDQGLKRAALEQALKQAEQALRVDTLAFERGHPRLARDYALTMTIARELTRQGFWSRHWKKIAIGGAVAVGVAVGASGGGSGDGPSAGASIPGGGVGAP